MFRIVLFYQKSQVYTYDYLDSKDSITVISPHPSMADIIHLKNSQYRPNLNIESITMAEFRKKEIQELGIDKKMYKKYELLLELSVVWKKYFADRPFESFLGGVDLFTDLRSFSINFDLIEEGLISNKEALDIVEKFWKYLEARDICDEHKVYALLTQKYEEMEVDRPKSLIFYGFDHLSSGQCDLIKSLSRIHDVYVPIHGFVYQNAKDYSWIKWLSGECVHLPKEKSTQKTITVGRIQKNRLNEALINLKKYLPSEKGEILLAQKNPTFYQVGEIPFSPLYFKVKTSVLKNTYTKIFFEIHDLFGLENVIETDKVIHFLDNVIQEECHREFAEKDFKRIKVAHMVHQEIKNRQDLSELNQTFSLFDYRCLRHSLELELPRHFASPMLFENMNWKVSGLEGIESVEPKGPVVVCVTSDYQSFSLEEGSTPKEMMDFLLALGPLKSKELEVEGIKQQLIELLSGRETILVIEEGIVERDLFWAELLSLFNVKKIDLTEKQEHIQEDYIKNLPKEGYKRTQKWSATRIQSYIQCPRMFYYKYVESFNPTPLLKNQIDYSQRGRLEHQVISSYLQHYDRFDPECHETLVAQEFEEFLRIEKVMPDKIEYENTFLEIVNYSANGIKALLKFQEHYPTGAFSFEESFENESHHGKIDCVVRWDEGIGIWDFKRSSAGIPRVKEMKEFEKIQLWYYLHNFALSLSQELKNKLCFIGYLNLCEIKQSMIVINTDSFLKDIPKEHFQDCFPSSETPIEVSFKDYLFDFQNLLSDKISEISQDRHFLPIPKREDMCRYCWIDNVCVKEVLS